MDLIIVDGMVAAAHINPLIHFLSNGIHEGRSPFADGHFGSGG